MPRIQHIEWSKLIESVDPANQTCELGRNDDYVADYQFDDPKLGQHIGELISQAALRQKAQN